MCMIGLQDTFDCRLLLVASVGQDGNEEFTVPEAFFDLLAVRPIFRGHRFDTTHDACQESMGFSVEIESGEAFFAREYGHLFVRETGLIERADGTSHVRQFVDNCGDPAFRMRAEAFDMRVGIDFGVHFQTLDSFEFALCQLRRQPTQKRCPMRPLRSNYFKFWPWLISQYEHRVRVRVPKL